jgi:hypothetical protein
MATRLSAEDELTGIAVLGHSAPILSAIAVAVVCDRVVDGDVAAKWLNNNIKTKTVSISTAFYLSQTAVIFANQTMARFQKMNDKEKAEFCTGLSENYGKNGKTIRGLIE